MEKIVGMFILVEQPGRVVVLNESRYPVADFMLEAEAVKWAELESAKDDTPEIFG